MFELRVVISLVISLAFSAHAIEKLSLPEARQRNPEFFFPGLVTPAKINDEPGYIICVYGKKDFETESPQEILSYLRLRSKKNLIDFLDGNESSAYNYSFNRFSDLYQWEEGNLIYANFFIPIAGIQKAAKNDALPIPSEARTNAVNESNIVKEKDDTPSDLDLNAVLKSLEDDFLGVSLIDSKTHSSFIIYSKTLKNTLLDSYLNFKNDPNSIESLRSIAQINEDNRKTEIALKAYLTMRSLSPTLIEEVEYKIAVLYEANNDLEEALKEYCKFNNNFKTSKLTPIILRKINSLNIKK